MLKNKRILMCILVFALLCTAISAHASNGTTVWAINDAAQPVSRSYEGADWIGRISFGQSFELLETKGDYVKLRNVKGNVGWTARENIAYYDPCNMNLTLYVQASGEILWPQADFEDEPIRLKKNDSLQVVGITPWKVWYRVLYNGSYCYVPCQLLAHNPAPENGSLYAAEQRYVFGSGVDLHSTPEKKAADFIAYIDDGTAVRLLSVSANEEEGLMAKVQTADGTTGYIHLANLVSLSLP